MARTVDHYAPRPPRPGAGPPPSRPRRPEVRRRRLWLRRVLIGALVLVLVLVLAAVGGWAYLHYRLDQVKRVNVAGIAPATGGPMNILVVGSDSRSGFSSSQQQHYGSTANAAGQRSDVTMVVRIDPGSGQAAILSIPRDLYVPIAGSGQSDRINSAYNNGPSQLIQTIKADLGISINHYVGMNFSGFQGIVDAVGGINMYFPYPAKDTESGLNVTAPGCVYLNGANALALARSRYYQYLANGYWHYPGDGDLGRIQRQHTFLRVLMAKAVSSGLFNPIRANDVISQAVHDVTVDSGLSSGAMVSLALAFHSLQPSSLPTYTIPTTPTTVNGAAVLLAQQPGAQQVVSQFLATGSTGSSKSTTTTAPAVSPSSFTTEVLNGSGVSGQAGRAAADLRSAGFHVVATGDASSFTHTASVVVYAPGKAAQAAALAARVTGGAQTEPDASLTGAAVALVTGSNYSGLTAASSSSGSAGAPATTPTTVPGSTIPPYDPRAC